jgi:hypothetical protein
MSTPKPGPPPGRDAQEAEPPEGTPPGSDDDLSVDPDEVSNPDLVGDTE